MGKVKAQDEATAEVAEEAVTEEAPKMKKKVNGVSQDSAITVLVESNPKRAGSASYDRFEGYLTDPAPATVKAAIENGLTMGDIHYDFIHGSITVEGAEVVEYMPSARGPRTGGDEEEAEVAEDDDEDNF